MNEKTANCTALILAAGSGSRIANITTDPKCLLEVNNRSLLDWHLTHLESVGIRDIVLVVGYKADRIQEHLKNRTHLNLKFIKNADFSRKGNGYSMFLGLQGIDKDVLVLDADLIYDAEVLKEFMGEDEKDQILIGKGSVDDVECAKTLVDESGCIRKLIDKRPLSAEELSRYEFAGEAIGIMKFSDCERKKLIASCGRFFSIRENLGLNWEHLMNFHLEYNDVHTYFTDSNLWIEIDTPHDYKEARLMFEVLTERI